MIRKTLKSINFVEHRKFLLVAFVGVLIWFTPPPEGISKDAWQMLAVFAATILGIIIKALPMGGMALVAMTVLAATQTLPLKEVLSGFSNPVVWLIVLAFFIAKSFVKTGLGIRIAYIFVKYLGKKSLGLAYGMAMTDLVLAPAIPSNTARGGGIVYPIIKSLSLTFGSDPEKKTERKIGSYLIKTAFQCNVITSAMFLTAMAANPLIAEISKDFGIDLTWGIWALAALVPGIISLALIPLIIYKLYPPEIKETPEAPSIAKEHLTKMGKLKLPEKITLAVFFLMLFLWIFGSHFGLDATTAAFVGISILIITGVLNWDDLKSEQGAWDTLFWFSALLMMASYLNKLGLISYLSDGIQESVSGVHPMISYILLLLSYCYLHYLFASNTAYVSSMFAAFATVGIAVGIPPLFMALSLAFATNVSACMTHYSTASAPLFFGSGYVDLQSWWKIGAIISVFHLIVWFGIGPLWWKVIGVW